MLSNFYQGIILLNTYSLLKYKYNSYFVWNNAFFKIPSTNNLH